MGHDAVVAFLLARAGHSIYLPFFDYGGFPGLDVGEAG